MLKIWSRTVTHSDSSHSISAYRLFWALRFYFWVRWIVTLLSWDWFTSLDFHFRLQFRMTQQGATLICDISYLQRQCNEEAATPRFSKSSDHCCFLHGTTIWGGIQWLLCSHYTGGYTLHDFTIGRIFDNSVWSQDVITQVIKMVARKKFVIQVAE